MGTRETSASNAVATIDSYRDIGVANLPKPCAIVKRIGTFRALLLEP